MLLLNILSQQVTPDICQKLKQDQARGRRMPASPEVMATFFAGGISESLRSWFTGGKKRSEEDSKKQLSDIMRAVYPRWTRADTLSSGKKPALDIVIVLGGRQPTVVLVLANPDFCSLESPPEFFGSGNRVRGG